MKTSGNTFGAFCYDQNSIEELKEAIADYDLFGNIAADENDLREWDITPKEWINQIKDAFYDKITDLVEEAKEKAVEDGSFEISEGAWLMTGKNVLEETADYRNEMDTDEVSNGYTVDDIQEDGLYIQANNGVFSSVNDDDIRLYFKIFYEV